MICDLHTLPQFSKLFLFNTHTHCLYYSHFCTHTVLFYTVIHTKSIQCRDTHSQMQLALILIITHTISITHGNTYNYSIPTLSQCLTISTIIHTVHIPTIKPSTPSKIPFPYAHDICISYPLTTDIHITSKFTHIIFPFLNDTRKLCIFPSYTLLNNSTQIFMISTLQIVTCIHCSIPHYHACLLYLSAATNIHTSYFPQHHTHKHTNPVTYTMYLSSTIILHFPHSTHSLHPPIIT